MKKIILLILVFAFSFIGNVEAGFLTYVDYKKINKVERNIKKILKNNKKISKEKLVILLRKYKDKNTKKKKLKNILNVLINDLEYQIKNEKKIQISRSYFGLDNKGLFYYDYEFNVKKYFENFEKEKVKIISDNFFVYKEKKLYSTYGIQGTFKGKALSLVYSDVDLETLKILDENNLYDIDNIYSLNSFNAIENGIFDFEKKFLLQNPYITCFNTSKGLFFNKLLKRKLDFILFEDMEGNIKLARNCIEIHNFKFSDINDIEFLGNGFVKIKNNIYYIKNNEYSGKKAISDIEVNSFKYLKYTYAKDKNNIYRKEKKLEGLDIKKIKIINKNIITDGKITFYKGIKIESSNLNFVKLSEYFIKNDDFVIFIGQDKIDIFSDILGASDGNGIIKGADTKTFEVIGNYVGKDKNNVYFLRRIINLNPKNVKRLIGGYYKDNKLVFRNGEEIYLAKPSTFMIFNKNLGLCKDDNFVFASEKYSKKSRTGILIGIDAKSFEVLNFYFGKDKDFIYYFQDGVKKIYPIKETDKIEVISNNTIKVNNDFYDFSAHVGLYKNWKIFYKDADYGDIIGKNIIEEDTEKDKRSRYEKNIEKIKITEFDTVNTKRLKNIGKKILDNFYNKNINSSIEKKDGSALLTVYEGEKIYFNINNIGSKANEISLEDMKTILESSYPYLNFTINSEKKYIESYGFSTLYSIFYYNGIIIEHYNYLNSYRNIKYTSYDNFTSKNNVIYIYLKNMLLKEKNLKKIGKNNKVSFIFLLKNYKLSNYLDEHIEFSNNIYEHIQGCINNTKICFKVDSEIDIKNKNFSSFYDKITYNRDEDSGYFHDKINIYYNKKFLLYLSSKTKMISGEEIKKSLEKIFNNVLIK